ncbi:MAG: hypothetical protein VX444_08035 [Pseudomonadota bacterium]|nr:hypothetical protein [Pseudomonadota bacterium]
MIYKSIFATCAAIVFLQACQPIEPAVKADEPTTFNYTEASLSGLRPVRPYPNADDVCELLGESKNTEVLRVDGADLIACPKHEKGAIADRKREGARVVGNAKHWVILSVQS